MYSKALKARERIVKEVQYVLFIMIKLRKDIQKDVKRVSPI